MSATVLCVILAVAFVSLLGGVFLVVCLIAGAARPLRRGSGRQTASGPVVPPGKIQWRPRAHAARIARRPVTVRRSAHSRWRG